MLNKRVIVERKRQLLKERASNEKQQDLTSTVKDYTDTVPSRNQSLASQPSEP